MGQYNNILAGDNNLIAGNSNRCTIINGAVNVINNNTNTHIIGDNTNNTLDNSFYVGCGNGIWCDGDVVANQSSDERLKDNIIPISGCLDKILKLDGVRFNWNDNQEIYSGEDVGLIAQQVQKIAPEIVTTRKDGYLAVRYEKLVPILIGAIQEQDDLILKLEEQINV